MPNLHCLLPWHYTPITWPSVPKPTKIVIAAEFYLPFSANFTLLAAYLSVCQPFDLSFHSSTHRNFLRLRLGPKSLDTYWKDGGLWEESGRDESGSSLQSLHQARFFSTEPELRKEYHPLRLNTLWAEWQYLALDTWCRSRYPYRSDKSRNVNSCTFWNRLRNRFSSTRGRTFYCTCRLAFVIGGDVVWGWYSASFGCLV